MSRAAASEGGGEAGLARKSAGRWRLALLLSMLALFSGILLTGVSVWFLGAVALAGAAGPAYAFNFHFPAALVRLFALSRTAAKYGERLTGHKAALVDQVSRRVALFSAMADAPRVRGAGWQLGDQERLADFIDDVEDVDFARLRYRLPLTTLISGLSALLAATMAVAPLALVAILPVLLAVFLCVRRLLPSVAADWRSTRQNGRVAGQAFGTALAAAVPLRAEHAWPAALDTSFTHLSNAGERMLRSRRRSAMLDALVGLTGPMAAVAVLVVGWTAGLRAEALLPSAFIAFAWLALGESAQGASRMLLARIKEDAAKENLNAWTADSAPSAAPADQPPPRLSKLDVLNLQRRAPDGRRIGGEVNLALAPGRPTVLTGPSGSGKTSLLKQVAGWLEADEEGRVLADGIDLAPAARRQAMHLSLHDAAILSDTVRENLFAPAATDSQCREALDAVELGERIRAAGGLDGWITQDMLSLGEAQRLNLARALLSPLPVILLDEPAEHLDPDQAARIVARLSQTLADRIVLVSSHGPAEAWSGGRAFGL